MDESQVNRPGCYVLSSADSPQSVRNPHELARRWPDSALNSPPLTQNAARDGSGRRGLRRCPASRLTPAVRCAHFPPMGVNATEPSSWPVSTPFPSFVNATQYPGIERGSAPADLIAFVNFGFSA